jgi:hypothetical protein
MVCADGDENDDNTLASLASGDLRRSELQRNAANICRFVMGTNAFRRHCCEPVEVEVINRPADENASDEPVVFYDLTDGLELDLSAVKAVKGTNHSFALTVLEPGWYDVTITASSTQSELAQIPLTIFAMGTASGTLTWNGTGGEPVSLKANIPMFSRFTSMRLYFAQNGLDLINIRFDLTKKLEELTDISIKED